MAKVRQGAMDAENYNRAGDLGRFAMAMAAGSVAVIHRSKASGLHGAAALLGAVGLSKLLKRVVSDAARTGRTMEVSPRNIRRRDLLLQASSIE